MDNRLHLMLRRYIGGCFFGGGVMKNMAYLIDVHYATFGIITNTSVITDRAIITDAAPIAKWMIGKRLRDIKPWLLSKKAKVWEI